MNIDCPTCNAKIEQRSLPHRGPVNDGSEGWLCLKCKAIVCVWCYHQHTEKEHPNMGVKVKK